MKDLASWTPDHDQRFSEKSLLAFDLDDTLTEDGALPADVHKNLSRALEAGFGCALVTGRSAGWADALLRLLPFDCVVAENGAVIKYWSRGKLARKKREAPTCLFWSEEGYLPDYPQGVNQRIANCAERLVARFPRTKIASDQIHRLYDLAIDFAEEVDPPLSFDVAEKIKEAFEEEGAVAKVSSIHVNGWWGDFSKSNGLRKYAELRKLGELKDILLYVGDSPNDAPLFKIASVSVGVANIEHFADLEFDRPQYCTKGEAARGAIEVLEHVLRYS